MFPGLVARPLGGPLSQVPFANTDDVRPPLLSKEQRYAPPPLPCKHIAGTSHVLAHKPEVCSAPNGALNYCGRQKPLHLRPKGQRVHGIEREPRAVLGERLQSKMAPVNRIHQTPMYAVLEIFGGFQAAKPLFLRTYVIHTYDCPVKQEH